MKSLIKRLIPKAWLDGYHRALAHAAAAVYRHPSEKMIVIGVTGTNGKSTTANFIAAVLEESGHKVGLATTVNFRVAGQDRLNDTKMTMLGRFALQRLLARMVKAGCQYAIIETSSEGIKQHRHEGIHYDAAVFTNLTPEHIESHGGFENYKKAKGELFAKLTRDPRTRGSHRRRPESAREAP
ncbi:MAG: Mur ligase family protein, partial [Patescibacteria group bacterium]